MGSSPRQGLQGFDADVAQPDHPGAVVDWTALDHGYGYGYDYQRVPIIR